MGNKKRDIDKETILALKDGIELLSSS